MVPGKSQAGPGGRQPLSRSVPVHRRLVPGTRPHSPPVKDGANGTRGTGRSPSRNWPANRRHQGGKSAWMALQVMGNPTGEPRPADHHLEEGEEAPAWSEEAAAGGRIGRLDLGGRGCGCQALGEKTAGEGARL